MSGAGTMTVESGGTRPPLQQMMKPLETLVAHPYEALSDAELRNLLSTLSLVRADILNCPAENFLFWDAFVALTYHAVNVHRLCIAEKSDRVLENSVCDAAKTLLDYCVQRLPKPAENSFLTLAENLKLIEAIYNLGSPYGKNEVLDIYRQLTQARVPSGIRLPLKTASDHDEEKKDGKKSHTVPAVPIVNVKSLITPIMQAAQDFSDAPGRNSPAKSTTSKFSERYGKKLYWYLCENRTGDKLLDILRDLPVFSSFMETDVSSINFFKGVITRISDARQVVGKVDILSSEIDVALHMSKIPLPDCCSPENLEIVCSFGISCIANTCKLLTALNVVDSQSMVDDSDGSLQRLLNESRLSTMKKAECLTTVYEHLEKSISLNNGEAAKNMIVVAARYFLASVEGMLMSAGDTDTQFPAKTGHLFCMPALYLVRHFLGFLGKLTDDLRGFEIASSDAIIPAITTQLLLSEIYTPWSRIGFVMRQHDVFNVLLRTLSICHGQAFSRLMLCRAETQGEMVHAYWLARQSEPKDLGDLLQNSGIFSRPCRKMPVRTRVGSCRVFVCISFL